MVLCPNGQGTVCKTVYAGSNPVGASAMSSICMVEETLKITRSTLVKTLPVDGGQLDAICYLVII